MEDIYSKIEEFKKVYPEIEEALEIFKIGMNEYQQAFKFINQPQIYTSNSSVPSRIKE